MQRVTNCILIDNDHILLIKKPRRGWYSIPGGKMEQGETIKESVIREYWEETGLTLQEPTLNGVFTFNIFSNDNRLDKEWMMFTFTSRAYHGELNEYCIEGKLEWIPVDQMKDLPMAEGDRIIFQHMLCSQEMLYGSFSYTTDDQLIETRIDPEIDMNK